MYPKRRETERELTRMPNPTSCQQERWEQPVPPLPLLRHLLNLTGHYQLNPHLQDPRHRIHYPIPRKLLNNFQPTNKLRARSGSRGLRPRKLQRMRGRLPATLSLARSPRKCTMLGEYVANATLLNFLHCFVQKSGWATLLCGHMRFTRRWLFFHCFCSRSHSTSLLRRNRWYSYDTTYDMLISIPVLSVYLCHCRYLTCPRCLLIGHVLTLILGLTGY